MTTVAIVLLSLWALYSGWRFYRQVDWDEPADFTPDMAALHKREAEILHIQGFLEEAQAQGKLSKAMVDEFRRFVEAELASLRNVSKR